MIGSRPTPRTRCIWPGCCGWTRSPRSRCPSVEQEAARDLVRAREDCRGDLMRARHRLSKLLLRHGHRLLRRAAPGPARTTRGCAAQRVRAAPATSDWRSTSDYEAVLAVKARRDRLDAAIAEMAADSEFTPVVRRLGCLRGCRTLTGFALAVEIGDWHRFTGNTHRLLRRAGAHRALLRRVPGRRARSPRPATATPAGCWSRPPGTTAPATGPARRMRDRWELAPPAARARGDAGQPAAAPTLGRLQRCAASAASSPTSPSPASWPAGAGPWPSWTTNPTRPASSTDRAGGSAWSDPRHNYEQPTHTAGHARPLDTRYRSSRTPRPAVTNPRISV